MEKLESGKPQQLKHSPTLASSNFIEINASKDIGIDLIRGLEVYTKRLEETIIYLNEADRLTSETQDAVKSILENKGNAIFILDGNSIEGLTDPIISRCAAKFIFMPPSNEEITRRLLYKANGEGIPLTNEEANKMAEEAKGDMRAAIGKLETITPLKQALIATSFESK